MKRQESQLGESCLDEYMVPLAHEQLSNDNRELRNDIRARVAAEARANSGDGNNKRRVIFGLRI